MTRIPSAEPRFNPPQEEAIRHCDGPLVVFAGAGSGKTLVISYRIANLIRNGVPPSAILAVTFTNKAAKEMKERVEKILGLRAKNILVSTFHSACARFLRVFASEIGYTSEFSIYDDDDKTSLLKSILAEMKIDSKFLTPAILKSRLDTIKNQGETPREFSERVAENRRNGFVRGLDFGENDTDGLVSRVYDAYQQKLKSLNAMDFNDLLLETVLMLENKPQIQQQLQNRFRYFLVDEFQDTNPIQFRLIQLLSNHTNNLCIVGDDDQSIYSWRGAEPSFIVDFTKHYPNATVVKLEQNYRSTAAIIKAASELIACNRKRAPKTLWTDSEFGAKIGMKECYDVHEEARHIVRLSLDALERGAKLSDIAILYRTNAQSRVIEDELRRRMLPYVIYGSLRFYERAEIRVVLCYLKLLVNPNDNLAFQKVVNTPRRGLGDKALEALHRVATAQGLSLVRAAAKVTRGELTAEIPRGMNALRELIDSYARWHLALQEKKPVSAVFSDVVSTIKFRDYLASAYPEDFDERWLNIMELKNALVDFENSAGLEENELEDATDPLQILAKFLQQAQLVTETKTKDVESGQSEAVTLTTIHAAKGLEFERVHVAGLDEGVLPHFRSLDDPQMLEEERRLLYVAMTRARSHLTLSRTKIDPYEFRPKAPSRFLCEVPRECLDFFESPSANGTAKPMNSAPRREERFVAPSANATGSLSRDRVEDHPWQSGQRVKHKIFGEGVVKSAERVLDGFRVTVQFRGVGQKTLVHTYLSLVGPEYEQREAVPYESD